MSDRPPFAVISMADYDRHLRAVAFAGAVRDLIEELDRGKTTGIRTEYEIRRLYDLWIEAADE